MNLYCITNRVPPFRLKAKRFTFFFFQTKTPLFLPEKRRHPKNFRQTTRHSPIAALLAVKHDRTVQNIILGSVQHRRHSRLHAHIVDGTGIFHRSVQNFKITVTSLTRLPITQRNVDKRAVAPSHINVHPVLPVGISDGIYTC